MPVTIISVFDSSWSKAGALRWMGQRSWTCSSEVGTSMDSPRVLNTWPLTTSPTGTLMGSPVSRTSAPRIMPSWGARLTVRTRLSPRCWATSRVTVLVSPPRATSVCRALFSGGRAPTGNSTSTTGPVTRAMRPVAVPGSAVPSTVAVTLLLTSRAGTSEGVGAADDLADLVGDLRLAGLVGLAGQGLDKLLGVIGRRLHRVAPRGLLRGGRLQEREIDPVRHVLGQQLVQRLVGGGLELVQRLRTLLGLQHLGIDLLHLQRKRPVRRRVLGEHGDELGGDDVDLVHAVLGLGVLGEPLDESLADF